MRSVGDGPLVSVVIPCFNSERFLPSTLESVSNQTYRSIEIICVDNGSADQTIACVRQSQSQDQRIILIEEPRRNASRARNSGLLRCKGEYVQFLDSDDLIEPTKLERQLDFMVRHDLDVVVSDRVVKDENLENILEYHSFDAIELSPVQVAISSIIITGNPLYKRSFVVAQGGYNEALEAAQDWEFHIRLFLRTTRVGYLPGFFLICRKVAGSLSADWVKVSMNAAKALMELLPEMDNKSVRLLTESRRKVGQILFVTAITTNDIELQKNSLDRLKQMLKHGGNVLNGAPAVIYELFGVSVLVAFYRWKNRHIRRLP